VAVALHVGLQAKFLVSVDDSLLEYASRKIPLGCGQGEINNGCLHQRLLVNATA